MRGPYIILGLFLAVAGLVIQQIASQPRPQRSISAQTDVALAEDAEITFTNELAIPSTEPAVVETTRMPVGTIINQIDGKNLTVISTQDAASLSLIQVPIPELPMNATINANWAENSPGTIDSFDYELSKEPMTGLMSLKPIPRAEKGNFVRIAASADEVAAPLPTGTGDGILRAEFQIGTKLKEIEVNKEPNVKSPFRLLETQFDRPFRVLDTQLQHTIKGVPYRAPSGN